jgi:hypothetical protein
MPKKDAATAVLGMLTNVGAQTRPTPTGATSDPGETIPAAAAPVERAPAPPAAPAPPTVETLVDTRPTATVSAFPSAPAATKDDAPRTLRLRPATAQALRAAWLEAKRDDVLLTAQDFASSLVDEGLARRHRQRAASSR